MPPSRTEPFADLRIDHLGYVVADAAEAARPLVEGFGFVPVSAGPGTVTLAQGGIDLVLREPGDAAEAAHLARHGDAIADVALCVPDAAAAHAAALRRGAATVRPPVRGAEGRVTAAVRGVGDLVHTLVERPGTPRRHHHGAGLLAIDHLAVCVPASGLGAVAASYRSVFGFTTVFEERVEVGDQAMDSTVVQSPSGGVTLTLVAPDPTAARGQIDDFLSRHDGAGVQHVAFTSADVVAAVDDLAARGIAFLDAPAPYYRLLPERIDVHAIRHSVADLAARGVLVDEDHGGQLFQIFSRSVHPRGTLFYEVIERCGARTFGSRNVRALYEAVAATRAPDRVA